MNGFHCGASPSLHRGGVVGLHGIRIIARFDRKAALNSRNAATSISHLQQSRDETCSSCHLQQEGHANGWAVFGTTACITDDGVMLRSRPALGTGMRGLAAIAVTYTELPDPVFEVPGDYREAN